MILEFRVGHDILKKNNSTSATEQSGDYYKCKFFMDRHVWKNTILSAVFMNDTGYIETVPLGECDELLTCIVPAHIASGEYFSLYITDNVIKTNTISITLKNYHYRTRPKCNVIADIYDHINTKIDSIIFENYQLKCYSNGVLTDVIYLGNVDENEVRDWVNEELSTFKGTISSVALTGSYNDLIDVPTEFIPAAHTHQSEDIENWADTVDEDISNFIDDLIENL